MGNSFQEMTDGQLVQSVVCGDCAAFDEIVRRYCRPLTLFAIARTGSVHNAEDIVQETFLRAFQNINSFNGLYSLHNWLFTIAYRLIVSGYRKKKPQELSNDAVVQLSNDEPKSEEYEWLWQAARKLSHDAFTALWLRYKQDMTTNEIAQVMKKSKVMVRVLLHRSRKSLAERISNQTEMAEKTN